LSVKVSHPTVLLLSSPVHDMPYSLQRITMCCHNYCTRGKSSRAAGDASHLTGRFHISGK